MLSRAAGRPQKGDPRKSFPGDGPSIAPSAGSHQGPTPGVETAAPGSESSSPDSLTGVATAPPGSHQGTQPSTKASQGEARIGGVPTSGAPDAGSSDDFLPTPAELLERAAILLEAGAEHVLADLVRRWAQLPGTDRLKLTQFTQQLEHSQSWRDAAGDDELDLDDVDRGGAL